MLSGVRVGVSVRCLGGCVCQVLGWVCLSGVRVGVLSGVRVGVSVRCLGGCVCQVLGWVCLSGVRVGVSVRC